MIRADVSPVLVPANAEHGRTLFVLVYGLRRARSRALRSLLGPLFLLLLVRGGLLGARGYICGSSGAWNRCVLQTGAVLLYRAEAAVGVVGGARG